MYSPRTGSLPRELVPKFKSASRKAQAQVAPRFVVNNRAERVRRLRSTAQFETSFTSERPRGAAAKDGSYLPRRAAAEGRNGIANERAVYGSVQWRHSETAPLSLRPTAGFDSAATGHGQLGARPVQPNGTGPTTDASIGARQYGRIAAELRPEAAPTMTFSSADISRSTATGAAPVEQLDDVVDEWLLRQFRFIDDGASRSAYDDLSPREAQQKLLDILELPEERAAAVLADQLVRHGDTYNGYLEFQAHKVGRGDVKGMWDELTGRKLGLHSRAPLPADDAAR